MNRSRIRSALFALGLSIVPIVSSANERVNERLADRTAIKEMKEERVIRAAYARLAEMNRASRAREVGDPADALVESLSLKFELRNFRHGAIEEVLGTPYEDLLSNPHGDIIMLRRQELTLDETVSVAYAAAWKAGRYAGLTDPLWTVDDVFRLDPAQYYDVGRYATYDVTVWYEGRSRTYRAAVVFHDLYDGQSKAEFWDTVIGMGGTLTNVAHDTRPVLRVEPRPVKGDVNAGSGGRIAVQANVGDCVASPLLPYSKTNQVGHEGSGYHWWRVTFSPSCCYYTQTLQRCDIGRSGVDAGDVEGPREFNAYHIPQTIESGSGINGAYGQPLECISAAGVAFDTCITAVCGVGASWSGAGLSLTVTGADLWSDQKVEKHECNLTQPQPPDDDDDEEDLTDCQLPQREETMGGAGSELVNVTTECGNNSPIIIDLDGDGYDLTSGAGGVLFDLNGNGEAEALSWTSAGSDDAFLVLDTSGNGFIDNGRELFGNFTPQFPGGPANGYRALAVYDDPSWGGNADGRVDSADAIFASLRLWRDANHNGISEPSELETLAARGIERLHLAYKLSKERDEHGNMFRYRAKVDAKGTSTARWSWDVFLVTP